MTAVDQPVTLVTGGGSGIGAALCRRLAAPGVRLLVHTGSRREKAETLAEQLRVAGAEVVVAVEPFGDPSRAVALVDAAAATDPADASASRLYPFGQPPLFPDRARA